MQLPLFPRNLLLIVSCLIALNATFSAATAEEPLPNILMICIDDLNDWVGCLDGHPETRTPHIDALAEQGRLFTNAHCAVTVCSPSRISIMSGLFASSHGSYELGPAYEDIERLDDVPTLPRWFKDRGYTTMVGGKVLHHDFGGRLKDDIDINISKRKGGPRPKKMMNWPGGKAWDWGEFPPTDDEMYDYQLAGKAAEVLSEKQEKPFFLSVGFFRPHVPMFAPPKWFDLFDEGTITLPGAAVEDMADIPRNFQYKMGVAPTFAEIKAGGKWNSMVEAYLANTAFVDHCVGTVMEGLNRGPNRDNTLVVLWSDHGFHLGEKQHIAKRTLWEESTRVPLIFAGRGISKGKRCAEPVSLVDLYPTLIEWCGLEKNEKLEGVSLVPQLKEADAVREVPAVSASYFGNYAVRSRDWRYIRYADGAEELYDHRVDPDEQVNLANAPASAEVKADLYRWIPKDPAPEVKPLATREQVRAGVIAP
ncbi:sulfatase [Verrucomicrobiales bacterium BCK34]|nr:sulfatase [Verrucomicrobiales bacterium BCK34]